MEFMSTPLTVNVKPRWWHVADPRIHWMKVNAAIWAWDHPMRKVITSVTFGFRTLEVSFYVKKGATQDEARVWKDELQKLITSLEPESFGTEHLAQDTA